MTWYADQGYNDIVAMGTPIWENIYTVRVATKNVQSVDELRHFGLPTHGDAYLDRQHHNELMTIMLTIDAIFEKWKAGIPVHFVLNQDAERVYQVVYDYLSAWNRQLAHGVNIGGAPVDDLIDLDRFASKLFEQSRMFNGSRRRSQFSFIESLQRSGGLIGQLGNKLTMAGKHASGEEKKPDDVDQHASFAEAFAAARFIRSGKKEESTGKASLPTSDRWGV